MKGSEPKQQQLVKELSEEIVSTWLAEYDLLLEESVRTRNILFEAAVTLRRAFKNIDAMVRRLGNENLEYQAAYKDIIVTLQFEDIVSQIIGHQVERAQVTRAVLERVSDALTNDIEMDANNNQESLLIGLRNEIGSCHNRFLNSESVLQEDLLAGDSVLF